MRAQLVMPTVDLAQQSGCRTALERETRPRRRLHAIHARANEELLVIELLELNVVDDGAVVH